MLAYGLPGIVAVLLIALLRPVLSNGVLWLVAAVVVLPLVGYIITRYIEIEKGPPPLGDPGQQKPIATISRPTKGTVERTIPCSGTATGVQNNMHLWLAIETLHETEVRIWPKAEVFVNNNRWDAIIFEDGATRKFSISLFIADPEADKTIKDWLEDGRVTGEYPYMTGIAGSERLDRVEGLSLKKLKTR